MARSVTPGLRALLFRCIDYAGMFPPAGLSVDAAVAKYRECRRGEYEWMLGRFVVSEKNTREIPSDFDGALSVLSNFDHPRAAAIESKGVVSTPKPTYCEAAVEQLDEVQRVGSFAKVRTGGISPEVIPSIDVVAIYIHACAARRLAFKATAGLHHPIRAIQSLTYERDSPHCLTHGFINFLMASAFAWHGEGLDTLHRVLEETDAEAFHFADSARWRDRSLNLEQLQSARRDFIHSFGSCSFEDPITDLQNYGWL